MLNLKQLRLEKKMSQSEVASILGVTQQAYANYERGARQADYNSLKRLADYFNVSIDYLLGNENKKIRSSETEERISQLIDKCGEDAEVLVNQFERLTPENQRKVIDFARFQAQQQHKDTDKTD